MARVVRWRPCEGDGLEHLVLADGPDGVRAEAVVIGTGDDGPFAIRYALLCDAGWRVRMLEVVSVGDGRRLAVRADGAGRWTDEAGAVLPALAGAIDVDIAATPFTNTLPIRRLGLAAGQAAEIVTAYVSVPALTVVPDPQRYTCLVPGRRYRYESLDSDFVREIETDGDGLVTDYPGLFRRVV